MSLRREIAVSRTPMAGLATVGLFWGTFGACVPDLKAISGLDDRDLGLALLGSALGGMVSMYLAPRLDAALGRWMLPVTALALLVPLALLSGAGGFAGFAVAMLTAGLSVAMLDIAANLRVSALETRHGMSLMNVNHAMFSFAFGGAAFCTGLARKAGLGPVPILAVAGLVVLAMALLMTERRRVAVPEGASDGPVTAMPWLVVILAGWILLASFMGENAAEAWSALHIERTLGGLDGIGAFGPTMLGLSMGIVRLMGQGAARRFGPAALILASAALGATGALGLALAGSVSMAVISVAVMGTGMAVIVPSANSLLGLLVSPNQRAVALSRAWMIGFLGFFAGPSFMGYVAEGFGLRWAFGLIALLIALILPAALVLKRRGAT
ncbi:MFS transporter [Mesobacterium pallidum]|uniref:MFS transporter n=1 Tax=Mesobacterium pallidum TaxID=2872037 RepID=UPI001EE2FCEE|nr:MFS transporter [Mesobacterium pallidum]